MREASVNSPIPGVADCLWTPLLERAFAPMTFKAFQQRYLYLAMFHNSDTFAETIRRVFGWDDVNNILNGGLLPARQVVLARDGATSRGSDLVTQMGSSTRFDTLTIHKQVDNGTTLILEGVERPCAAVRALSREFSALFHVYTQANAYIATGSNTGFDLHWDDHDTYIFQVVGAKLWTIYSPTLENPVRVDGCLVPPPEGPPASTVILREGDVLYLPRGWWHVAAPLGCPTVHLTFGVPPLTASLLLRWLGTATAERADLRKDIPLYGPPEQLEHFIRTIAEFVSAKLTCDSASLTSFVNDLDAAESRHASNLPAPHVNSSAATRSGCS